MGGNNEHTYTVYSRAFSRVDSSELAGSSSNRTFTNFNLDRSIEVIANDAREAREVGLAKAASLQARGYLLATELGSSSWVASLNMEEAWSDHPEGIRWLP
jgi:hypothetical protein